MYLNLQLWVHNTNFQSHYQINKYTFQICIFITTYLQSNKFMVYSRVWAMFPNTHTHAKKLYSCCFPSLDIKISVYHSIIHKVQTPWHFRSCKSNLAVNCKKEHYSTFNVPNKYLGLWVKSLHTIKNKLKYARRDILFCPILSENFQILF